MNKKITITIPEYLINILDEKVGRGDKSRFISEAIEQKLLSGEIATSQSNPVDDFFKLRNNLLKNKNSK